ncbi:MAG: dienelactone hydrolase [Ottowia sp.]|uniref:alpha/beta hydrolase family protein n=1 Tax=Ottowia sp. TaxID=1898956 RepID=UPI0039E61D98
MKQICIGLSRRGARWLAFCLATLAATAHAGLGLATLPGRQGDCPVTVFYPTAQADAATRRGPFNLHAAPDAEPARGNGRLVVVSHGSGGSPWVHADLARALVEAGYVVALPEHAGDNYRDPSRPGPDSWKRRPAEVSRAIDAVGADPRFAPLLDLGAVGLFGGSSGGHTALVLAGGQWSPARMRDHCMAHIAENFSACAGYVLQLKGNAWDGLKQWAVLTVQRWSFRDDTPQAAHDARIRAAVASVPYAADFDMDTLAAPRIPLGLVTAALDLDMVPRFHSERVLAACGGRCEQLAHFADGGHSVMLSPWPPEGMALPAAIAAVMTDPPGFDRASLAAVDRRIADFFGRHLARPGDAARRQVR